MRYRAALALCGALAHATAAPADVLQGQASEPRAFGYQVGDLVERRVSVHAPAGWRLDESSLPRPGGRGLALELRRVAATVQAEGGGRRHQLALEYQVFLAPAAVRTLEMPALHLRFDAATRSEEVLVEAWPVTVAPLVPVDVSPRRGLGELRPDRPPPLIDTAPLRARLLAYAAAAALLLAWLAVAYLGPPWRLARNRPFGRAWRQVRHLPANPTPAQWRAACRALHEALNRSAGEVVFEHRLGPFLARQPAFRGLGDELASFLQQSRREFFGAAACRPDAAASLVELCRRCRDAERGLA